MGEGRRPRRGRHFRLAETLNSPQPLRTPPISSAGGEKKTLRLVAKYADRCNLFVSPDPAGPAAVAGKLDVLREHCRREGTDYDRIHKTVLYTAPLSPGAAAAAQFTDVLSAYAALGVTEVHVMPMDGDPVGFVRNLGARHPSGDRPSEPPGIQGYFAFREAGAPPALMTAGAPPLSTRGLGRTGVRRSRGR